jgi:putative transposase
MEVRRTAPVKLVVPDERRDDLPATKDQFLHCANRAAEFCWDNYGYDNCVTSKAEAERALYDSLRDETDDLHANLVQKAIGRAVEAVKSGVDRWKKGKRTNQPHFDSWSVVYDKRAATIHDDRVSLATPDGRVECEYVQPADETRETPYSKYVANDDFEFRTSTLQYDAATQEFYFHLGTRSYDSETDEDTDGTADTEHQTVLGIDLGVNSLAVASTGRFWQGDDYDHWVSEFEQRRAKMQQRETQAAHNALLRLGKRERAWRKQYIHTVSNEIVTEAVETGCDVIVFEELTDIRERLPFAEWHHYWAFRRLYEYVSYKAPDRDVAVKEVTPNHTSQRCSQIGCGFTHDDNRDGEQFCCQKCDYEVNADYNAAKNIGLRYARKRQHSLRSAPTSRNADAPVDVRIHGGTLNGDGPAAIAAD